MKTANELEGLDMQATDAENEFWIRAGETIQALIGAKGRCVDGIYYVNVEKLFGKEPPILYTSTIKNDESEYSWIVDEVYLNDGVVMIQCGDDHFSPDSFRRSDVIRLARLLEKYDA